MINPAQGNRNRAETVEISSVRNRASYIAKYHSFLYLQPFNVSCTWRDSSQLVRKACIDFSRRFCISKMPEMPDGCDFVLCVSWIKSGVVYRRKLWENLEEVLYYPLYTNEVIESSFYLEAWNVRDEAQISLLENLELILSIHDKFAFVGELASHTYNACDDMLLNFEGFNGMTDVFTPEICPPRDGVGGIGKLFYSDNEGNIYVNFDDTEGYTP